MVASSSSNTRRTALPEEGFSPGETGNSPLMGELLISLLVAVAIAAPFAVMLARQGFPGSPNETDDDGSRREPQDPGPTGEEYPPGARPAGPGAERMTDEPPAVEVIADDDR